MTAAWGSPFGEAFPCFDVHVHLHPAGLARAIERHFAARGWVMPRSFEPAAVAAALRERGVRGFCFFSYAHKPGMSRALNQWVAETAAAVPGAIGLGTLHPDDPDLEAVAAEATGRLGLRGFKFHHSVQRFHVDDPRLLGVYERAEAAGHVFMLHVGTLPYRDEFTGIEGFRRVMERFPRLRVCVAHMGAFQSAEFLALLPRYPHVYVDTTMAMTAHATPYVGADPTAIADADLVRHQDRVLFGSDFPLIPYDYDEERRWAWERPLTDAVRRKIFHDNALR
ncbi:MAG TPA: amidohydrolase family protein, partial [Methylomirabilota bacterium]|nr:amidohydrolase family protein [Methylomirabilota bacterium]